MKDMLSRLSRKIAGKREKMVEPRYAQPVRTSARLIEEALGLHRAGRLVEAETLYRQVLAGEPSNFDAVHLLGVLAQQTGNGERAVELILRAVDIRPDDASARSNLGLAYRTLGRFDEAESALRRSVKVNPDWDRSHATLGLILRDRGDLTGAEIELTTALRLNPSNDEALTNLANIYREARRFDEAEALYRAAVAIRPDRAAIWKNLAALHQDRSQWKEAESCLRAALENGDSTAEVMSNLGFALLQLGRFNEAEAACREALALQSEYPDALVNLASVLQALGDLEAAEELCRSALASDAVHVAALVNLGTIRKEQDDASAAEACYRRATALDAQSAAAKYNLGMMLLLRGDYGEGFDLFEARFEMFQGHFKREPANPFVKNVAKLWRGDSMSGRRAVIWTEQGHGDSLMMLRYLPLLKARGAARVIFVCEPELARIAAGVAAVDQVITWDAVEAIGEYDLHCPTMSLPHCFRTTLATIPAGEPHVAISRTLLDEWKERLANIAGPRVGLTWAGNETLRDDAKRSISLGTFEPILNVPGVQFLSLQKGDRARQAHEWRHAIIDHMEACRDFMDTAALIGNLDLVITVDTAVAHLAGAMGKPVWLLNRAGSEWRWGLVGERTAWYPTMRIFRQQHPLDWAPVMKLVASELKAFAGVT